MKLITKEEAVQLVKDGDFVGMTGFASIDHPETVSIALEERFLATGHPCDLTIQFSAGIGDGKLMGSNHYANPGMLKRVIAGHYGLAPRLAPLINDNAIEAYNLPYFRHLKS